MLCEICILVCKCTESSRAAALCLAAEAPPWCLCVCWLQALAKGEHPGLGWRFPWSCIAFRCMQSQRAPRRVPRTPLCCSGLAHPFPVKCINCSVSRKGRSPPSDITSQQCSGFAISGVSWRAPSLWQGLPELRSAPRPLLSCASGGRARSCARLGASPRQPCTHCPQRLPAWLGFLGTTEFGTSKFYPFYKRRNTGAV